MDFGDWFKRRVGEIFLWIVFWVVVTIAAESIVNGWWNIDWIKIVLPTPVAFMAAVLFIYLRDLSRYEKYMRERVRKNMSYVVKVKKR